MARQVCRPCGRAFEARHPSAKYCSARCRTTASRHPELRADAKPAEVVTMPGVQAPAPTSALATMVRRELEKAKRLDTALGVHVLKLAERIDRAAEKETGAGYAALDKAFRAAYAEALAD